MLKERIDQDLKKALLGGDKVLATTLRGLKSVILYAEVAEGMREQGLPDEEIVTLFAKEAKKRQESADLYSKGGNEERAQAEVVEKKVIETYLPRQLSDEELEVIVDAAIASFDVVNPQIMGKIIGAAKQEVGSRADGSRIAQMVKERLN
ncbi:MAG TPA: GatB/YqeY domain-containing protein [Patescibacteria group bacterium]|nr:GatB/YqeY domain-containing protein [Patescibacteria group bacterium]